MRKRFAIFASSTVMFLLSLAFALGAGNIQLLAVSIVGIAYTLAYAVLGK